MKACLFTIFLTMATSLAAVAQESLIENLDKELIFRKEYTMKLYKFNVGHSCDQVKGETIMYDGKLSRCFDYIRDISPDTAQQVVRLMKSPDTYGNGYSACFFTEYALLIINTKSEVHSYVSLSFKCNQLTAYPGIKEQDNIKKGELYLYGFSKKGYAGLSRLLLLTKDVGLAWKH
ncbi:hypothetical protein AB6805_00930 [Chitinophaga sp. RCC_12]|uniref:hypothetical protein n=1 Tax=Chitinophaga sp. RCC_12 TaxID=3239226 RepID=UPI0035242F89